MRTQQIKSRRPTNTFVLGTVMGVAISCVMTLLLAGIAAVLILNENLMENITPFLGLAIVFASSFAGTFVSGKASKERKLLSCIISSGVYFFILLTAKILLLEGEFSNVFGNVISIILSAGLAIILVAKPKKQNNRRKIRKLRT